MQQANKVWWQRTGELLLSDLHKAQHPPPGETASFTQLQVQMVSFVLMFSKLDRVRRMKYGNMKCSCHHRAMVEFFFLCIGKVNESTTQTVGKFGIIHFKIYSNVTAKEKLQQTKGGKLKKQLKI